MESRNSLEHLICVLDEFGLTAAGELKVFGEGGLCEDAVRADELEVRADDGREVPVGFVANAATRTQRGGWLLAHGWTANNGAMWKLLTETHRLWDIFNRVQ